MQKQGARRSMALAAGLAAIGLAALAGMSSAAAPPWARPADDTATPTASASSTSDPSSATPTSSAVSPTASLTPSATNTATLVPTLTLSPTMTSSPTLTPSPTATARPAPPGCRMAGTALVQDAGDATLFWARIQNTGLVSVTLTALQTGWAGSATLGSVLLRRAGADAALFTGMAPSPALVSLASAGAAPRLLPGESASLGLRFVAGMPAEAATPGPAVLFTAEGCLVPLADAPAATQCGLRSDGVRPASGNANAISVGLTNGAAGPATLASVEVRWPVADNGSLVAVQWDGGPVTALPEPLAGSPAVLNLESLLGAPVTLAAGRSAALRLVFAQPAAPPPAAYTVVVATREGCLATATTVLGSTDCGVTAQGFETRASSALLRLNNRRPVTRTLSALTVFWPAVTNGPLVGVAVDGRTVWTGELTQAPAAVVLPGVPLPGEAMAQLQLSFRPPIGRDGQPSAVANGDYTVVAWLQGGCAVTFATANGQPLKCSVSAGEWTVRAAREAGVDLTNAGAEATLRQVALSWPRRNGYLIGAWLGNTMLFSGRAAPQSDPFVLRYQPGRGAVLARNDTRSLRLNFDQTAMATGYSASLEFDDPAGAQCASVLVTSRPAPVECKLSLPTLTIRETVDIDVAVDNEGADALEVASVTVDWPNPQRLINLTRVSLLDAAGNELELWHGKLTESPATVRPAADVWPLLPGKAYTTLRIRFGHRLDMPDRENAFKVTLNTVEGCQASFAPAGGEPSSQQTRFSGFIAALPHDTGLYGTWQVDTDRGPRPVAVDRTTRFTPASASPRLGDAVVVRALVADGQYYAQEINFTEIVSYQTLEGTVEDLGPGQPPAWLKVAGTLASIAPGTTEIHGQLERGANVTVVARRSASNNAIAETITVHAAPRGEPVLFIGVVQDARKEADSQVWEVDRYTVRIPPSVDTGLPANSLPPPGKRVQVKGHLDGLEVLAEQISLLPDPVVINTVGRIVQLPAAGLLGEWKVDTGGPLPLTFRVESPSVVDTRTAPAVKGMLARLRLQDAGEGRTPVALRVRIDWPD